MSEQTQKLTIIGTTPAMKTDMVQLSIMSPRWSHIALSACSYHLTLPATGAGTVN
jgi:hypothetical protein